MVAPSEKSGLFRTGKKIRPSLESDKAHTFGGEEWI